MVKTLNRPNSPLSIVEKRGFSETFPFSKITFWKKKTLTSLDNYSTHLSSTGITFQHGKVLDTVQLLDITTRVLLPNQLYNDSDLRTPPESPGASSRGLLQLDRPEAMTKYKLVIPIKGIMILVFQEKSFKSLEEDYSNHLSRSLVAYCGEISLSP